MCADATAPFSPRRSTPVAKVSPTQAQRGVALAKLQNQPTTHIPSFLISKARRRDPTQALRSSSSSAELRIRVSHRPALIAQADKLASLAGVSAHVPNLKPWSKFLGAKLLLRSTKRNVFDWSTESRFAPQHLHLFRNKGARFVKDVGSITMHWRAR